MNDPVMPALRSIESAPRDGSYILLFGESGYRGTPLRCEVCRYDDAYHPLQPWVSYADNSFLDSGGPPLYWLPLPASPSAEVIKQYEPPKTIFTTGDVAKLCKVAPRTVSKWFDSGRLRGYRIPGSQDRRIPREYLVRFLKEHGFTQILEDLDAIPEDSETGDDPPQQ